MIRVEKKLDKTKKVTFKGNLHEIKDDVKILMWSMIQKDENTRKALIEAIDDVNNALHQMEVS